MVNEDIYLKKLGRRGKIVIWQVDGKKIRSTIDPEFSNYEHCYISSAKIIPEYEFWIDREAVPDERRFYIDHLLTEWQLMKKGVSLHEAERIANNKERSERVKSIDWRKILDKNGHPNVAKFHLRLMQKVKGEISIWLVDGKQIRSVYNVEFTEGGHDLVYDFVPKNEVWIDNDMLAEERPYVILHELYERGLMSQGMSYPDAHRKASRLEWQSRHDDLKLRESLKTVGWL
jgi:hypothetical protein